MSFFIIIFWAFFLWILFKAVRFVWRGVGQYKKQRDAWEQFYRQATGQEPPRQRQRTRSDSRKKKSEPRRRRKIFSREDGEYVEFEDIIVSETETTSRTDNSDTKKRTTTVTESQIVDVEWEDLP